MHTSTSPQYAIIASCDVAAAMMERPGGTALVEESLTEALEFRRAMIRIDEEMPGTWWFSVWGPDTPARQGLGDRHDWDLHPADSWHGFSDIEPGFTMLDPIKATILTPGLDVTGTFGQTGIPAVDRNQIPRRAWRHRGEDGALFVFHHVHHRHHQGSLEHAGDRCSSSRTTTTRTSRCEQACRLRAAQPGYEGLGLRDLCQQIHDMYKSNDVARVTTEMYLSDLLPAMKPSEAFAPGASRD